MIGRIAYGMLFIVLIPVLLAAWAQRLEPLVNLPRVEHVGIGIALLVCGLILMAAAMQALWVHGEGLPMNAYPPKRFVTNGPYRYISQPIYTGFVLACAGVAISVGSSAGLWIITPMAIVGCTAIVLGYEQHDMRKRFGEDRPRPLLSVPPASDEPVRRWDVASVYLLLLLPWLVLYEAVGHLPAPGAIAAHLPFEHAWRVIEWTEIIYASTYVAVVLVPWAATSRGRLRQFFIAGAVGTFMGMLFFVVVPFDAPPRVFVPETIWGKLLLLEHADGVGGSAALPSFHVFWAFMVAWLIASRSRWWVVIGWTWAVAVSVSCITTGMHALLDIPAGFILFLMAINSNALWHAVLRAAQCVANSWREWRFGPVRIINHGLYAGLAAGVGVLIAGSIVGSEQLAMLIVLALASLVGAGLWGQYFVGSKSLLRPFGYFGSVVGVGLVLGVGIAMDMQVWLFAGAAAVAAPWVQAVGRLRCLVQGCCHGSPVQGVGIRYRHARSRVCTIAHLDDVPLHATPVYSMLSNVVIGALLARLWFVGISPPLLVGLYLILSGVARFIEESLRGEPLTPIVSGLRLYQWFALGSMAAGWAVTWIALPQYTWPTAEVGLPTILAAVGLGLVHIVAMGVDFPDSNRRLSRLV